MIPKAKFCIANARECRRRAEAAEHRGVKQAYRRVAAQWSELASKRQRSAPMRASGRRAG
jgi:hypothetical protein